MPSSLCEKILISICNQHLILISIQIENLFSESIEAANNYVGPVVVLPEYFRYSSIAVRRRLLLYQPSRSPRHDQYEISGLSDFENRFLISILI